MRTPELSGAKGSTSPTGPTAWPLFINKLIRNMWRYMLKEFLSPSLRQRSFHTAADYPFGTYLSKTSSKPTFQSRNQFINNNLQKLS